MLSQSLHLGQIIIPIPLLNRAKQLQEVLEQEGGSQPVSQDISSFSFSLAISYSLSVFIKGISCLNFHTPPAISVSGYGINVRNGSLGGIIFAKLSFRK